MENEIPGTSILPETAHVNIKGNEIKIKLPAKLSKVLKRCFRSK